MRILIATDAFPPIAGGSGWSSYYLARALRSREHKVAIVKATLRNDGIREEEYDGFKVVEFGIDYRKISLLKRFRKRGYFFSPFYRFLRDKARGFKPDIIHAQHQLTAPPSIEVGEELKIPVVVTVRDYWPLCFHSTGLKGDEPCPGCSIPNLASCFYRRFPGLTPFLPLLIPFALSNLRFKQEMLTKAAKMIAVSHHIKGELRTVFPEEKIAVIPNLIDSEFIEKISSAPPEMEIKGEFLLYVGKLSINKGVRLIPELMRRIGTDLPLIIAGEGPLREELEKKGELFGLNLIFTGWLSNEEVIRLMRRARLLLFPSAWGEPLSRVLLEALSAGATVAAINTGGTGDIIDDEVDGLLAADFEEWVDDVKRIIVNPELSKKLAEGAKEKARKRFDALVVAPRFEDLYRRIISSSNQGNRP